MSTGSASSSYRRDIDGLRAIAVLAVIANHFNKSLAPNGFLGVDVFFLISGYVITSSLSRRPTTTWSDWLASFYARRMKRLLPALLVCIAVTVLLGSLVIPPYAPAGGSSWRTGVSAIFGLSNLYLHSTATDYFAESSDYNLFTQTWSLGVEEQFYFFFPLLLWLTGFAQGRVHAARRLALAIGGLGLGSLGLYLTLANHDAAGAFFLMPARFWELGLGCLAFLTVQRQGRLNGLLQRINPCWFALPLVALLFVLKARITTATLAAAALTWLLLVALRPGSAVHGLLTRPIVLWFGALSYSLYLWHWSVLVLSRWTIGIHPWTAPGQAGLMLLLGWLSYRWIETPGRQASWPGSRAATIRVGLAAACLTALTLLGFERTALTAAFRGRPAAATRQEVERSTIPATTVTKANCSWYRGQGPTLAQSLRLCTLPARTAQSPRLLVLGDSHAGHLTGLLDRLHHDDGIGLRLLYVHGQLVPLSPELETRAWKALDKAQQGRLIEQTMAELQPGDVLVISNYLESVFGIDRRNRYADDRGHPLTRDQAYALWLGKLEALAQRAARKKVPVVVVLPLPKFTRGRDLPPPELCVREWFRPLLDPGCEFQANRARLRQQIGALSTGLKAAAARQPNLLLYDPFSVLCPAHSTCQNYLGGRRTFFDDDHLNNQGGALLYDDFLRFLSRHGLLSSPAAG
ncbi:acyltransferase [Vulcanococcus limneticus Candia 3F8]|uniref:acyltransferase family protein n=1 Tax=Vulcanococcus limneticus TaxID=2170428 RepID=UPI000B98865D|nr:acyltransferase family protein [Vulcanococcus limneticus]MCP9792381.1 acyltransferase [Vulcanococcus limneticus MW73D5]MCP9894043.1 acyltransferase [Vulcanococcus limneticus Candia 3F8]MCP9897775.1 acyltransferase [Vulcanococcus limneticus Candia 3B3]